jgi:hypothetical protein
MEVIGSKAKRTAANAIAPHPNAVTFVPSSQNAEQDTVTFRYRGGEFPVGETRSAFSSRKRCAYSRDNPAEAAAPPPTDNGRYRAFANAAFEFECFANGIETDVSARLR